MLPGHREAAVLLLERMEARARELSAGPGVLRLQLNVKPTLDTSLLTGRGYRTIRRYQVMTRTLAPAADPAPTPPAGLTLRHCAGDEADRHRAHALVERTFAAHFGHVDRSYETWLDHLDGRKLDWSLVWIASLPGHGDVAVLLTRDDRTSTAWVSHIGVAEEVRGRGSAASCSATASPSTRSAAGTAWASAWTPATRPARSRCTRRTAWACTTRSTRGSFHCTPRGDRGGTRGCNRANEECAGPHIG